MLDSGTAHLGTPVDPAALTTAGTVTVDVNMEEQ